LARVEQNDLRRAPVVSQLPGNGDGFPLKVYEVQIKFLANRFPNKGIKPSRILKKSLLMAHGERFHFLNHTRDFDVPLKMWPQVKTRFRLKLGQIFTH
jgi:hypothetical protein